LLGLGETRKKRGRAFHAGRQLGPEQFGSLTQIWKDETARWAARTRGDPRLLSASAEPPENAQGPTALSQAYHRAGDAPNAEKFCESHP